MVLAGATLAVIDQKLFVAGSVPLFQDLVGNCLLGLALGQQSRRPVETLLPVCRLLWAGSAFAGQRRKAEGKQRNQPNSHG